MYARTLVNFRLAPHRLALIDQIAAETASSRSDVIRMALRITLADPDNLKKRLTSLKEQM